MASSVYVMLPRRGGGRNKRAMTTRNGTTSLTWSESWQSNITSTSTDHVNTRWNPPATQHNQSATKISTPNMASNITHSTTNITHSVKRWTPPATLQQQHDGVLAGKNHNNAPVVEFAVTSQRDNALKIDCKIERVKCINGSNKDLKDEDLDELIKEINTSTVLREIKLSNNLITLADGRFTAALASNTSLQKINLHGNTIGDEGVRSLASALKVNNTLRYINLIGNQISKDGAQFLAEALIVNTSLDNFYLQSNRIGDEGVQSLCAALKVNTTLTRINLNCNQISKVGVKFLADALMVNIRLEILNLIGNKIGDEGAQSLRAALKLNSTLKSIDLDENQIGKVGSKFLAEALTVNTTLESIYLNGNNIGDEGAQSLAESFTVNRSLRSIQLCNNRITDIGATQLADAIEFNCDCGVTTINLNGNQVSISLLDRIKSICKAKDSSKGNELSSTTIIQTAVQSSRKRNRKANASKDDQIALLKEHIARLEKDNARLNDNLRHATPIVETIDLTTDEAEHATKRSRTETDVKSNQAIMYEQNQKIVQIKQENAATKLANHTVMSTFKELSADLEDAHAIMYEQTQKVIHIKKEKMDTEMALESIRGEKNVVEADLKEVKDDLEDAKELVGQMSLTTDIWQGRFDELVALMESGHADGASINAIRNRPLGSGK